MNAGFSRAAALWILCAAACTTQDDDPSAFRVVLLGDSSRAAALEKLAADGADGVRFSTPPPSSDVMEVADLAHPADLALIVNDATQGPTPIIREHILLVRQLGIPSIGILLSKTDDLLAATDNDRELLDLVELELRELVNQYDLPGDSPRRFYDSEAVDPAAGLDDLLRAIAEEKYPRRSPLGAASVTGTVLRSEIYLLTVQEADQVQPIASGDSLSLWIDGRRLDGVAESPGTIQPGDGASLTIRVPQAITVAPGTRFIFARNGQLIGIGTLAALD